MSDPKSTLKIPVVSVGTAGNPKFSATVLTDSDATRLSYILARGFTLAQNYGDLSPKMELDRYHVVLNADVTPKKLLAFCHTYCNHKKIPHLPDPYGFNGPELLVIFQEAQAKGLVKILPADSTTTGKIQ
jgi:hypothetical protein